MPKHPKVLLFNQKKSETEGWRVQKFSLLGQIDYKNTKEESKLLIKCFVNSLKKNPPISARNVAKLPEMSLFEPRKKSKKRIAISKLALQYFKLTAKIGRRRFSY